MPRYSLLTLIIAELLICTLVVPTATAETYKWTDPAGKVHYTDTPPSEEIEHEAIDLGECKTDACRNELKKAQDEAAQQLQQAEKLLNELDVERKKPPRRSGYLGH